VFSEVQTELLASGIDIALGDDARIGLFYTSEVVI
jgi:hypothetical protein